MEQTQKKDPVNSGTQYNEYGEPIDMSDWPEWRFAIITGRGWACGDTHDEALKKIRTHHGGFRKNSTPYLLVGFSEPVKGFYVEMWRWHATWSDEKGGVVEIPFNGWGK